MTERLGIGGEAGALSLADLEDYPEIPGEALEGLVTATPSCDGLVPYTGKDELHRELAELADAVREVGADGGGPAEVFVLVASPGVIATYRTFAIH